MTRAAWSESASLRGRYRQIQHANQSRLPSDEGCRSLNRAGRAVAAESLAQRATDPLRTPSVHQQFGDERRDATVDVDLPPMWRARRALAASVERSETTSSDGVATKCARIRRLDRLTSPAITLRIRPRWLGSAILLRQDVAVISRTASRSSAGTPPRHGTPFTTCLTTSNGNRARAGT